MTRGDMCPSDASPHDDDAFHANKVVYQAEVRIRSSFGKAKSEFLSGEERSRVHQCGPVICLSGERTGAREP